MTRLLAIETSSSAVGVALLTRSGDLAETEIIATEVPADRRHVETLHPAIEHICAAGGVSLGDLDGIGVDVGPGLFTGIRVGVAAAKGIAMALGLPAAGLSSLEILAEAAAVSGATGQAGSAASSGSTSAVPVVDLRRGEVAWSGPSGVSFGPVGDLVSELETAGLAGASVLFVGDGALRYAEVLCAPERPGWATGDSTFASPPVASLARLTLDRLESGLGVDSAHLEPCYLREADARINWTTRHDGPSPGGP